MEIFIKILKIILPTIISGLFTFIITKYNYNKNVPLDNFKIAYNRVYYPIYKILCDENTNKKIEQIIFKISPYLKKYDKYVDRATLKAFKLLNEFKDETTFENFRTNIYNKNSYLRRRLGYLEPSFFQIYFYSSKNERSTFRILIEFIIIYVCFIITGLTKSKIQTIFTWITIIFAIIFVIELILIVFRKINKTRDCFKFCVKSKN